MEEGRRGGSRERGHRLLGGLSERLESLAKCGMALIRIRFQLAHVGADELVEGRRQLLMTGERDESLGKSFLGILFVFDQ